MHKLTKREFEAVRYVLEEHYDVDAGPRAEHFAEFDPKEARRFDRNWDITREWLERNTEAVR
jgi:hypothetical protein